MQKHHHTAEQIIRILEPAAAGAAVDGLCRQHGTSRATFHMASDNPAPEPSAARGLCGIWGSCKKRGIGKKIGKTVF